MEPTLIKNNKIFNSQKKVIVTLIIFLVCLFIGTSYSILTSTDESEEVISFTAGELNLEVKTNTDTSVNFPDELPKSEDEVEKTVILNIKNTGSLTICEYRLKLVPDTSHDSPASDLEVNYIRYAVSLDNGVTYKESKLLSETNNQIYIGFKLKSSETKTLYVKVWLDEETLDNEEILNKSFYGKIEAELLQRCETVATVTLKETLGQAGGIIGVTNDNQKVTEETNNIREYRYSGLGVNNYVTFNDEIWRIIGIFKDESGQEHLKILRNEVLPASTMPDTYEANGIVFNIKYNNEENAYWNYNANTNDWVNGGLKSWLNSEGTTAGYLKTLTNQAQNMIENAKWYLGNVSTSSVGYDTTVLAFEHERGSASCGESCNGGDIMNGNKATWIGKIALMYPSDYGFSADSSNWGEKRLHFDWISFRDSSWLQNGANHYSTEWFLSPSSFAPNAVTVWESVAGANHYNPADKKNVRPTLYLKPDIVITSGKGTSTDPYILK